MGQILTVQAGPRGRAAAVCLVCSESGAAQIKIGEVVFRLVGDPVKNSRAHARARRNGMGVCAATLVAPSNALTWSPHPHACEGWPDWRSYEHSRVQNPLDRKNAAPAIPADADP